MVLRPVPPSHNGKSLMASVSLQPQDYRPFETSEPDVVFTGAVPSHWAMIYVDRSGNVRETSNLSTTVFDAHAREAFIAAKNNFALNGLPSPHTAYSHTRSPGHRGHFGRAGRLKRRRTMLRDESLSVDIIDDVEEMDDQIPLEIGDTKKITAYYENAFRRLQQLNCRMLAKNFIKLIEPRKQVRHPYNGGRPRPGAPPGEKGDPESTKPDWWPRDVIHREPDHLKKEFRLKLLVHIIQRLLPMGITADKLQEVANDARRHIKPAERAGILDEMFRVRRLEERYERNEVDATTQVYVIDHDKAKREEPDSDDEQAPVMTPESLDEEQHVDASHSPLNMAPIPQHVPPLETSTSFQMSADLNFSSSGQRTPEFRSSQSEISHRSLAGTPIAAPLLTPTSNQFIDHPQYVEPTPATQIHPIGQSPTHTHADPSASFAGWSPSFQQNMFSPVDYSGAGRQIQSPIAYQTYGVYSPAHDVPTAFAVPDLSRPREYDMANMVTLPFRTGSLSHPHVLHHADGGVGRNL